MKIINRITCLLLLIATLASCQKERSFDTSTLGQGGSGGGNTSDILGNWKFMGVTATTTTTLTAVEPGVGTIKTVSVSDYTSENNSGTLKIEAAKMTTNSLAYSINSTVRGSFYENNTLINSVETPFIVQMPPTNSSSNYKRIGADSVYFEAGGSFMVLSTGGPTQGNGAKIKIEGNKLLMTMNININRTIDTLGLRFNQESKINGVTTFQKL